MVSAFASQRAAVARSVGSRIRRTAAAKWSTASGAPRRYSAEPSSTSTSTPAGGGGGSASARLRRATAAAGAPRPRASAATRRRSSTRSGSPLGRASAIWAAIRSSDAPLAARISAARACARARSWEPMSAYTASRTIGCANSRAAAGLRIARSTSTSAARAASSSESPARRAASASPAPSPSTATARTRAVADAGAPERRRSTAWATAAGPSRWTRAASRESVDSLCSRASRRSASRKNGFPPVASRQAAAKSSATGEPSRCSQSVAVAAMLSGAGRSTVVSGAATRRARSAVSPSARARGREDGDRQALQARGQVGEQAQRLGVGPVQVVHREGHGGVGGQVVEQPVEAVQDRERAVGRGRRQRGGARGEERSREGRGALEQALWVRGRRDGRLQQLPHAAVGEVALELAGPRSQAREARLGGRAGGRPEQARLAQPGRALHEDGLAAPLPGLAQGMGDRRQLALALEEPLRHLEGHVTPGPWTAPRPPYRRPGSARFREPRRGGPRRGRGGPVVLSGRWRPDRRRTAT